MNFKRKKPRYTGKGKFDLLLKYRWRGMAKTNYRKQHKGRNLAEPLKEQL